MGISEDSVPVASNVHSTKKNSFVSRICAIFPWSILLVEYLYIVVKYLNDGMYILNSDMSAEMVLANLLNKEGRLILTQSWFYSTELRVANTQLVYKLGLALFPDWHLARTFSIALLLLILLAAFFFFAKQAELKNSGIWAAIILCCPLSSLYSWIVIFGCFYIPHLVITFLSIGLLIRIFKRYNAEKIERVIIPALLLCVLAAVSGLGGVRQMQICFLPAFLAFCFLLGRKLFSCENRTDIIRVKRTPVFIAFSCSFLAAICAALGYLLNAFYLRQYYSFTSFNGTSISAFSLSKLLDYFGSLSTIFGFQSKSILFSIAGAHSFLSLSWVIIIVLALAGAIKNFKKFSSYEQVIILFTIASLAIDLIVNTITNHTDPRYLIQDAIFCAILVCMILSRIPYKTALTRILTYAVLSVFIFSSFASRNFAVKYGEYTDNIASAVEWLQKNHYSNGYATFWTSNTAIELSNGSLDIWTLEGDGENTEWRNGKPFTWLQEKRHIEEKPDGRVFLLLNAGECTDISMEGQNNHLVYFEYGYYIFSYDSANELLDSLNDFKEMNEKESEQK